jgi:hypothetical protein
MNPAGPQLLRLPGDEFVQPEVVDPAPDRRRHAVEHQRLQSTPFCGPVGYRQFAHSLSSFVPVIRQWRKLTGR